MLDTKPKQRIENARKESMLKLKNKPSIKSLATYIFLQEWSNGATGFDDTIATQGFVTTDTIVILGPENDACVFFGDHFAYYVENTNEKFFNDVKNKQMLPVVKKGEYEAQS